MLVLARFVIADKVVQFTLGGTIIMNRDYTTLIARNPKSMVASRWCAGPRAGAHHSCQYGRRRWIDQILTDFPTLTEAQVRGVIAFAAVSAAENLPMQDKSNAR